MKLDTSQARMKIMQGVTDERWVSRFMLELHDTRFSALNVFLLQIYSKLTLGTETDVFYNFRAT